MLERTWEVYWSSLRWHSSIVPIMDKEKAMLYKRPGQTELYLKHCFIREEFCIIVDKRDKKYICSK